MFGRWRSEKSSGSAAEPTQQEPVEPGRTPGKGRPTPTRREAQAARQRPIIPTDRKAAAAESRQEERARRQRARSAMMSGKEWALPPRDRGAERAFVRDVIDARWSMAEFLLPILVVGLPISLIPNRTAVMAGYVLIYGAVLIAILDGFFMWFSLKKQVRARFHSDPQRGTLWYAVSRMMQIRPGRVPRPQVRRGERP